MATNKISYLSRDFTSIRQDLLNYVSQYYPDLISDKSASSVLTMLLELNAAVGDMLSFNLDAKYQETNIDNAQERKNILALAKTLGLNIPGKKASVTIIDFSVTIPVSGSTFDSTYAPILRAGAQVLGGGGKVFTTSNDIDFNSAFGFGGNPNRLIIPNIDANDIIRSYTLTKRELVSNGVSKIFSKVINPQDFKPFMEIILPDADVLSIDQVILLDGTNFSTNPTIDQFMNNDNRFWEVENLAEQKVFIPDPNVSSDRDGVSGGTYLSVTKKFIKEYTDKGFCKITFGGGVDNTTLFSDYLKSIGMTVAIGDFLHNDALGVIPAPGNTLFIKYKIGGGNSSNIGANVLTQLGNVDMVINGARADFNQSVRASLKCNNPIPALGGKDSPSIEEIRKLATYNFGAQNRCVTVRDYLTQVQKMPGQFGAPFRVSAHEAQNKVILSILALDENGKLENTSTNTLKNNIAEYLSYYRMFNDFIEVQDGKIINIGIECDLLTDKQFSSSEIASLVISTITDYFDIANRDMNENIYLGDLYEKINNVPGVVNILDVRIFGKVGGIYSFNESSQAYINDSTKEFQLIDNALYSEPQSMFEIKFPATDIVLRLK